MAKQSEGGALESGGMSLPAKLALGTAVGLGALITGFVATRQGRRFVRETLKGRVRPPLEYDVLEVLDAHSRLGRRRIDVRQEETGTVVLLGTVASQDERDQALGLAAKVRGVDEVRDGLEVEPDRSRRGR
ncbi:MAG: BON domain-containing protein [Gemmatimonadetes bacterium]|nr:BON domain-containing protein [Gemmatimonadota bacterium]